MDDEQYRREYAEHLIESVKNGTITRRELLIRASVFGFSATTIGRLLTASGGSVAEAAPAPAALAPRVTYGGTMKVVIPPPLKTLDPLTIYDQGGIVLVYQISEYLIDVSTTNALVPKLATKWTPNTKGDVWTFTLRTGVKFNDGSPFEAADVVATFENILNPANGSAGLSALQGVLASGGTKATGTHTVAVPPREAVRRLPRPGQLGVLQHRHHEAGLQARRATRRTPSAPAPGCSRTTPSTRAARWSRTPTTGARMPPATSCPT